MQKEPLESEWEKRPEWYMAAALDEALQAAKEDEVPIGALLIDSNGNILAADHNRTRQDTDPTAHAEILVLRKASGLFQNYRLPGTTLIVTIEPCLMCAGALIQARVSRLIFGALDPKAGAFGSLYDLSDDKRLNHRFQVIQGVMEEECRGLMQQFFQARRK
jgi:tRNA(adenine34) deaminase